MKLLFVGIDGGTKRIIDYMPMPFTHRLFQNAESKVLKEDLLSRGWAEILTGEHGARTKGYYLMPFLDKSYKFSKGYGKSDMLENESITPLWEKLNAMGASVGILNVPTTGPVDEVNGFMVAGGGGGLKPGAAISPSMVYPREFSTLLEKQKYVFDIRLPAEGEFSDFADRIKAAQEAQKNSFIELSRKTRPDFGFHCFRITTELHYLALAEIESYIDEVKSAREQGREPVPRSAVQEKLVEHYVHMDKCIENIFTSLAPEHFLFVGDHSTAPLKYDVNMDVFLEAKGYLKRMSKAQVKAARLHYIAAKLFNIWLAKAGLVKKWKPLRHPVTKVRKKATRAFSTFFDSGNFAGIYINDAKRFGGPVKSDDEAEALVQEICDCINKSSEAAEYGFSAIPYRKRFVGEKYEAYMPDIQIEKPDTVYFSCRRKGFIEENKYYGPVPEDLGQVHYPYTGAKGSDPIFVYDSALSKYVDENDVNDLRLAYRIAERYFSDRESTTDAQAA